VKLDFFRVLASAVKRDPTAAHYKYHDDPYLIPYNSMTKRDFIMSKEGGKKAARYVLDHHPELFLNNLIEAQPPIKAFMPKSIITEKNASLELVNNYCMIIKSHLKFRHLLSLAIWTKCFGEIW
jgi:hypothetical protein